MIDPKAIARFLDAPRESYKWVKALSRQELLGALSDIRPLPDLTNLKHHQLVGLLIGIACRTFCYWYGMGTGKTLLTLRLIDFWHRAGDVTKALILVPSQEAIYSWLDEIERWGMTIPVLALGTDTSTAKAERWLEFDNGIILIAYPSLCAMVTRFEAGLGKKAHKQRKVPRRNAIETLCKGVGMMVMDESTEAKNHDSTTHRVCLAFSKRIPIRYALAGRPFGRDPTDLWGQHLIIDHGESLGTTLGLFRESFFDRQKISFGGRGSATKYKFRKDMEKDLYRLANHRSLRYATEECIELPKLTRIVRRFVLPDENGTYYKRVLEHLLRSAGDQQAIQNDFIHMRQLSSGFLGVKDDEFGLTAKVIFPNNPKLELLIELLRQVPPNRKAIVFHCFTMSGEMIAKRLKEEKIPSVRLWSGTEDRRAALRKFLTDPNRLVLNVNAQLGSYALNLQTANHVFYFESPVGAIDRDQSERRAWRQGQERPVFLYDLCMSGGVDETILAFHRAGNSLFAALMHDPSRALASAFHGAQRPIYAVR